jgi:hypothetical protein
MEDLMPIDSRQDLKHVGQRGQYALYALLAGAFGGWLMIVAFSLTAHLGLGVFGVASMVAAASMLAGALFGFIFGVPRTIQRSGDEEGGAKNTGTPEGEARKGLDASLKPGYRANTNLEQISDWLTKILVGAGLTQISSIRQWLRDLGTSLAPGFGGSPNAQAFATATVICYALNGFLIGYLWTRLYFAGALIQAEDVESLHREIKDIKEQSDLDARAFALVAKQLNPSGDSAPPSQQEINEAIKNASQNVKAQIFYQAQEIRSSSWQEPRTKAKMERTIPIFRALIACDKDDEFHRNHGQLGYALKDQRHPDWIGAEAELTNAIQIRGTGPNPDWIWYEFNRAVCRIETDDNFKAGKKSSPESRKRILGDLQVAATDDNVREILVSDERLIATLNATLKAWINLNEVNPRNLS